MIGTHATWSTKNGQRTRHRAHLQRQIAKHQPEEQNANVATCRPVDMYQQAVGGTCRPVDMYQHYLVVHVDQSTCTTIIWWYMSTSRHVPPLFGGIGRPVDMYQHYLVVHVDQSTCTTGQGVVHVDQSTCTTFAIFTDSSISKLRNRYCWCGSTAFVVWIWIHRKSAPPPPL